MTQPKYVSFLMASTVLAGCTCEPEDVPDCPPPERIVDGDAGVSAALPIRSELREARAARASAFVPPTEGELRGYGAWVKALAKAAWSDRLPDQAPPPGFMGRLGDSGRLWLLQEQGAKRRGAGFVVLRPGTRSRLMLQVPHSFFDEGTLEIGLSVFSQLDAKVLLVNTVHRGGTGDAQARMEAAKSGNSPYDVAHAESSFFAEAHSTLTATEARLVAVQLHGFADRRAPGVKAIVSAAESRADARKVVRELRRLFGPREVRLYPDEIDVLGGVTNMQAKSSRKLDAPFIHLELSATARESLRQEPELLSAFARALRRALEGGP